MKHAVLALLLTSFVFHVDAQNKVYSYSAVNVKYELPVDSLLRRSADSAAKLMKLSDFEKDWLYYVNYCRFHPAVFLNKAVVPYLEAYPIFKTVYGESLVTDLKALSKLDLLVPDDRLFKIARLHALDLGTHNIMSHESSDGTTTQQRFQKIGIGCGSECINMGSFPSALDVLLSLLIDYRVTNFGHRKSLLNPKMKTVGVGTSTNSGRSIEYTVVDLGCD